MDTVPILILLAMVAVGLFLIAANWSSDMSIEGTLKGIQNEVAQLAAKVEALGTPTDLGPVTDAITALTDRVAKLETLVGTPDDPAQDLGATGSTATTGTTDTGATGSTDTSGAAAGGTGAAAAGDTSGAGTAPVAGDTGATA